MSRLVGTWPRLSQSRGCHTCTPWHRPPGQVYVLCKCYEAGGFAADTCTCC